MKLKVGSQVKFVKLDGTGEVDAKIMEVTNETYTIEVSYSPNSKVTRTGINYSKDKLPGTIH